MRLPKTALVRVVFAPGKDGAEKVRHPQDYCRKTCLSGLVIRGNGAWMHALRVSALLPSPQGSTCANGNCPAKKAGSPAD